MNYYNYLSSTYETLDLSKLGITYLDTSLVQFLSNNAVIRTLNISGNPIINYEWFVLNLQLCMQHDIIIIKDTKYDF